MGAKNQAREPVGRRWANMIEREGEDGHPGPSKRLAMVFIFLPLVLATRARMGTC